MNFSELDFEALEDIPRCAGIMMSPGSPLQKREWSR